MNNYFKFIFDSNYIIGYYAVLSNQSYDFYGDLVTVCPNLDESIKYGGWYKYTGNKFVEDSERKSEMIKKKESETTWQETIEAQVTYTALMTDTLIEEE